MQCKQVKNYQFINKYSTQMASMELIKLLVLLSHQLQRKWKVLAYRNKIHVLILRF